MSKTANFDSLSIKIFYMYNYVLWFVTTHKSKCTPARSIRVISVSATLAKCILLNVYQHDVHTKVT